jgi:site-specific DNA recombinase
MRAALYIRVSTDEQAKTGYSIPDQRRELERYAKLHGYEVVDMLIDDGYSGASIDRPGLRKVYEMAESGQIDAVLATRRDRLFRNQLYRLTADKDLQEYGVRLVALNDTGNKIGDSVLDSYAEWERETFIDRSRAGKRERARSGKVVPAGNNLPYGYQYNTDRTNYVPDPVTMPVVRRMFELIATGTTLKGICRTLDTDAVPTPGKSRYWNPISVRRFLLSDLYKPHTLDELRELGVAADVLDRLDPGKRYGVWYFGKDRVTAESKSSRRFKRQKQGDWIAVPIADAEIPREHIEAARRYFEVYRGWRDKEGVHFYELRGFIYCGACGRRMTGAHNNGYYYYSCMARRNHGKRACPESVNYRADGRTSVEHIVMRDVESLLQDPERVRKNLDEAIAWEMDNIRDPSAESATWAKVIEDCARKRSGYLDLAADGVLSRDELTDKLRTLDTTRSAAETKLEDARAGESRLEELRATKRGILGAYAHGILYDGIRYFDSKMRHDIYDALGLRVTVEIDGTLTVDYHVDANVIRLTREVEEYAAEPEITVGHRSRSSTDMSIVDMKCRGESWRPRSGAASTKVATTPALMAEGGAPAMRM